MVLRGPRHAIAMARQGRAGVALATAAIGSFFADTVATFIIASHGVARQSGAPLPSSEDPLAGVLDLRASIVLAQGSLLKALARSDGAGPAVGLIGTGRSSGSQRFTLGLPALSDGINFGVVAMGVFGVAEIVATSKEQRQRVVLAEISRLLPSAPKELGGALSPRSCAARLSAPSWASCGRRAPVGLVCGLRRGEKGLRPWLRGAGHPGASERARNAGQSIHGIGNPHGWLGRARAPGAGTAAAIRWSSRARKLTPASQGLSLWAGNCDAEPLQRGRRATQQPSPQRRRRPAGDML